MKRIHRLLSLILIATVLGASTGASADAIKKGYDLLNVKKGSIELGAKKIPLKGIPFSKNPFKVPKQGNFGNTNLKLKRKATLQDTGKIPIEMVALSLKSIGPVDRGREGKFNAFVTLDKRGPSAGKLKIDSHKDDPTGQKPKKVNGKFGIDMLEVLLQLNMVPVAGNSVGKEFVEFVTTTLATPASGPWSHASNKSYPTIPNKPSGDFVMGLFGLTGSGFTMSTILPASVSEPLTLALLGGGLMLIGIGRRGTATS